MRLGHRTIKQKGDEAQLRPNEVIVAFPQFNGGYGGSMGHYFDHICTTLEEQGVRVHRAVPGNYGNVLRAVGAGGKLADLGLRWSRSLARWMGEYTWFQICYRLALPKVPLVVIAQEYAPFICPRAAVVISHDMIQSDYPRSWFAGCYYRYVVTYALRRVRGAISVTKATQAVVEKLGIASEVVYPWIDTSSYGSLRLESPGVKRDGCLWIGTSAFHKDLHTLVAAARHLPDVSFKVVIPLRKADAGEEPSPNVQYLSGLSHDEMLRLYRTSQCFVSTSLVEGYGMPAMEAHLAGLPLVLSDIPVYRELHNDRALFFKPKDARDLVGKISQALLRAGPSGKAGVDDTRQPLPLSSKRELAGVIARMCGHG
jgi:glycosyltransferase involved in cell wall biosynthesis